MRFTEDQVRQALHHPDKEVRDAAIQYFSQSHCRNPEITLDVIELIERLGPTEAFSFTFPIADLGQSKETVDWAVERLLRPVADDESFREHLGWLFCQADPALVLPHRSAILASGRLSEVRIARLTQRLEFASMPSEPLWRRLESICEQSKHKLSPSEMPYGEADEIAEALARDATNAGRMMELLAEQFDPEELTGKAWLEIFLVEMAGYMRHEAAIPLILQKLHFDGEVLNDACIAALVRIGTERVIEAVRDAFRSAPQPFRFFAASVFGDIHCDLAVSAGLELLISEDDPEVREWLATALLDQFSTDVIDAVRGISRDEFGDCDFLTRSITACKLMNYEIPELAQWERELAEFERPWFEDIDIQALRRLVGSDEFLESDEFVDIDIDDEPEALPVAHRATVGRNDPCPCGSGKKFKKCCLNKQAPL